MGFFAQINTQFGFPIVRSMKKWKSANDTNTKLAQQLRFLLRCRQEGLIPNHLDTANINNIQITKEKNHTKLTQILNLTFRKILNIDIDDINARIKITKKKIRITFEHIKNTLPEYTINDFLEFESKRLDKLNNKHYRIALEKINHVKK